MTVNKSQGQTIPNVGVYLPASVFSHGQLYVAMSRATVRTNIKILPTYDFRGVRFAPTYENVMRNIFRVGNEYFVQLEPDSQVNPLDRVIWFPDCPLTFMEFQDVYRQPTDNFAGNSQMNLWLCFDQICYAYILMQCVCAVFYFRYHRRSCVCI
jgi:hypothetical protein